MGETPEEKVEMKAEKRDGVDEYSCSNILICKYPLHEVIKAVFFKCFGFETSNESAASPSPDSTPGPTVESEDMAKRFRPPPRLSPTRGSGPRTNSGNT